MARPRMAGKKRAFEKPHGAIRQSQVVTTFGPGAMVDLIDDAVLVSGLQFWQYSATTKPHVLTEPRLRDALHERMKRAGVELPLGESFRAPPAGQDDEPNTRNGIQVLEFPHWFVCQNPACRALKRSDGLDIKDNRYKHYCDGQRGQTRSDCVPVRFVTACRKGHLDEFPWIAWVHEMENKSRCAAPELYLIEGATGDFSEIVVRCICGKQRPLSDALSENTKIPCKGNRPWLGDSGSEDCTEKGRLLVRTASNAYFPQIVSALSIPEKGHAIEEAIQSVWRTLQVATRETLPAFRTIPEVNRAISSFADEEVLGAIESIRKGTMRAREPLRTAEYQLIVSEQEERPGEMPKRDDPFYARRLPKTERVPAGLEAIYLIRKLREVRAQVGFTRIEAASPDLEGEFDLDVQSQLLGLETNWLPATELLGEGIFIQLDEKSVQAWEHRREVQERGEELLAGYRKWAKEFQNPPDFPGVRFYLLHSLSHLLIQAISLECGYAASAIRERIYCAPHTAATPMAAILLMTGSTGSEGTLGGLVEQGVALTQHLRRAFDVGTFCANDPVCAGHSPKGDHAERFLEGAACHGCLFVAECSCERFNRYLDRALVIPTMGYSPDLAYFGTRP